jgi:type I restriction enzyme S subunit
MSETPKGYKMSEVGVIPEDWEVRTFVEVMTGFSSGATPYRGRPEYYKGDIRWITSGELNYNIITDTIEKITENAVRNTNLKIHPKGTFLMAITGLEAEGTRGSCGIVGAEATTNQSCMALFPTKDLLTEYLFHYYVNYGNSLALEYCQGTKQQSYTAKIVKILPIIVPPTIEEQQAIASALSDVDALITALGQLIAKKRNIKQGAMQQLLTGKKRLPGFGGEWEVKKLGEVGSFSKGKGIRKDEVVSEGLPCIRYGEIYTTHNDYIKSFKSFITQSLANESIEIKTGDLLFAGSGETAEEIGKCVAFVGNERVFAGGDIVILRPSNNNISLFLGFLLNNPIVTRQKVRMGQGDAVVHISGKNLSEIQILLPPTKAEQIVIATILSDMDAEIEALEQKRDKYKAIKQGMMQELLTGKMRLLKEDKA